MFLVRLILLPFKLALAAVETSFRVGRVAGAVPVRLGRGTGRLLGFRGTVGLLIGVALGLAFAPGPGRDLRARIRRILAREAGPTDADLAARVSFELEHAPRTWHLPQPSVTVDQGRVTLRGTATEAAARDELARVAAGVPGVTSVENLLAVDVDDDRAPAG
jgi:hypothetical protein